MTTQTNENTYFDLHTSGIGYLNRARVVKPSSGKRFKPFTAVSISALFGSSEDIQYSRYDVTCVTDDTAALIQQYRDEINNESSKVICQFVISDSYAEPFKTKEDELRSVNKGRLLAIRFIKIDGAIVYQEEKKAYENEAESSSEKLHVQIIESDHSVDSIVENIAAAQPNINNTQSTSVGTSDAAT